MKDRIPDGRLAMTEERPRILIIDDNQDDRLLARRELVRAFPVSEIHEIANPQQFESALSRGQFDAVVTDFQLGWATGLEILARVKARFPDCPVVMFTATANLEQTVEAMKAGLDDYVTKSPNHYVRLPAALRSALDRAEAVASRKRSEQLLAEHEQWMNAALRHLTEGVLTADSEARIKALNPESERLTGWTEEEALGRDIDEVLHVIDARGAPLPESPARRAIREHKPGSDDLSNHCVVSRSGKHTPVMHGVSLIEATGGALRGVVVGIRDISDRKKMETELLRSNQELQQFAYAASHDLQEPLRTMVAMSQLLARRLRGKLGAEENEIVGMISTAGQRMAAQIKGLLDYGRFSDHSVFLTEFPAHEAVQAAIENLQTYIEDRGGRVTYEPLPAVRADRVQLATVFQNLISNGLKYNTSTTPSVHIEMRETNGTRAIAIRDNGIGIPLPYRDKVFRLFARLYPARYSGTGIGLALVKRIVERADGEVWIESAEGEGSTFVIRLPWDSSAH